MNILFISKGIDSLGGVEKFITTLANSWSNSGNEVVIYSMYGETIPAYEIDSKVSITFAELQNINSRARKWLKIYRGLSSLVKEHDIGLIIGETIETSSMAALIAKRFGILSVGYEHYNYVKHSGLLELMRKTFYRHLSFFVPASPFEKDNYIQYGCDVRFIANPISVDIYDGYKPTPKTILNIGRLDYVKGQDILLKAFDIVRKQRDGYKLTIVGKDFGHKSELDYLASKLQLNSSVEFIDGTNQIDSYFKSSLFFVLPSREEGLSMVMLESMAFGVPILATDCVGPSFLIKDEENGFLARRNSVEDLAKKMLYIIDNKHLLSNVSKKQNDTAKRYQLDNIKTIWNANLASFGVKID
ncbi:glycosyltransferase family 4 protein [Vibrio sp. S9_S30]|uniref:glycosyltransferase n=1 Tax=Vibrio sp. S9_S30 TaxID=2720226 RepID=UPI001680A196|nr:glycosyltransferase [Vibrio sp. S9_S30]MBD1558470.1 glycosyltransferase family 4 protein [Vibrio sp. S9_S30]